MRRLSAMLPVFVLACDPSAVDPGPPTAASPQAWTLPAEGEIQQVEGALRLSGPLEHRWDAAGWHVADRSPMAAGTSLQVGLIGAGEPGSDPPISQGIPRLGACRQDGAIGVDGDCLRRAESDHGPFTQWWEPGLQGVEHGFEWWEPVAEGPLRVRLSFDLPARLDDDARGATLGPHDEPLFRYDGLAAWDQEGRDLPAWMERTPQGLDLVVDAEGATFPVTIDPLLSSATWNVEANSATAHLGISVAAAGDVNGDGFGDVVVGASQWANGQVAEGRVYVYLGTAAGPATTAAWMQESNNTSAWMGEHVASAGDVDGDGYSDVVAGGQYYGTNGSLANEGRVWVWLGSATGLATTAVFSKLGGLTNRRFGSDVAGLGDVNGDGYGDVAIGVAGFDNGTATDAGRVEVYLGSAGALDTTADWTLTGTQASAYLGAEVARVGDVNGDGRADLGLSEPNWDGTVTDEGRVRIYHGSATSLATTAATTILGGVASMFRGQTVDGAGDVNADGYGDMIVGAPSWDNGSGGTGEGRAWLHLGSASGINSVATLSPLGTTGASFGRAVAGAGDVNGDGYGDLLIGAATQNNGQAGEGLVTLYWGRSSGYTTVPAVTLELNIASASFGWSAACAGDTNGDGYADVIVGAPDLSNGQSGEGKAFVFLGGPGLPGATASSAVESNIASAFTVNGGALSARGDVNGDGFDDVLIGAPESDVGGTDAGQAWLLLGAASGLANTAVWTVSGNSSEELLGTAVSIAGDVDGDGYDDVLLGVPGFDNGTTNEGQARLFMGAAAGPGTTPDWTWEPNVYGSAGSGVAGGGDLNGDGYTDLAVASPNASTGRVDVFHGGASGPSTAPDRTVTSSSAGVFFGIALAMSGDSNADGFADLAVGSPYWDNGLANVGRAAVYLGSGSGLSTSPGYTLLGTSASAFLGTALAWSGDMNNDGYGDLAVGSPGQASSTGQVQIIGGSASGPSSVLVTRAGPGGISFFGESLSTAGDINIDGYADLVVGAGSWSNGQAAEGRAAIYLGGATTMASVATWTVEGNVADLRLGRPVAGGGDIDGDGQMDVVFGVPGWSNGQIAEGQVRVHAGNRADLDLAAGWNPAADLRDPNDSTILSPWSRGASPSSLAVEALGRGPWGRGDLRVQVEAAPIAESFDGLGLSSPGTWTDSGLTGAALTHTVTGLGAGSDHHVRLRVVSRPVDAYPQLTSRWLGFGDGLRNDGVDARTACSADADADLICDSADPDDDNDGVADGSDCAPTDPGRFPGNPEVIADAVDQDCSLGDLCYQDADNDGWGGASTVDQTDMDCTDDNNDADVTGDCQDDAAAVHPGATEVCDGWDDDCTGASSAPLAGGPEEDDDNDQYVDCGPFVSNGATNGQNELIVGGLDCNDSVSTIYPTRTELCDTIDSDCDGDLIDGFTDTDSDLTPDCTDTNDDNDPSPDSLDCVDTDATIYPGNPAPVIGNSSDNNCILGDECYQDADNDDFGATVVVDISVGLLCGVSNTLNTATPGDCLDTVASVHPGAPELCDGWDNDCGGGSPVTLDPAEIDSDLDAWVDCTGFIQHGAVNSASVTLLGGGDCDDGDLNRHPNAAEACDSIDSDCDGSTVDGYPDTDLDLTPDCVDTDDDGDLDPDILDCAPLLASVHHAAAEIVADGIDQNCSGADACWTDADDDGFGVSTSSIDLSSGTCVATAFAADNDDDCLDSQVDVHPGAPEECDGLDTDCGSGAWAPPPSTAEADDDGDQWIECASYIDRGAVNGSGELILGTGDCDDDASSFHPQATESCDALDQDCDLDLVDGFTNTDGDLEPDCIDPDDDGDGSADALDCASLDASIYPGATEVVADGIDQNCSGGDACWEDSDGDGFGSTAWADTAGLNCATQVGWSSFSTDCLPTRDDVYPGAAEVCDGWDNDCSDDTFLPAAGSDERDDDLDHYIDCAAYVDHDAMHDAAHDIWGGADCDDGSPSAHPGAFELCDLIDQDCDGDAWNGFGNWDGDGEPDCIDPDDDNDGSPDNVDCADFDPSRYPGNPEVTANAVDENCDGLEACWQDQDDDNVGIPVLVLVSIWNCELAGSAAVVVGDCLDLAPDVYPGAPEIDCDGLDNACGSADGVPPSTSDEADDDGDQWLDCAPFTGTPYPWLPNAAILGGGDCDDEAADAYPGAPELCDTIDQDCDGDLVAGYPDQDGDGLPDCADNDQDGDGFEPPLDCDDSDASIAPGLPDDGCDIIDTDCDLDLLEGQPDFDGDGQANCADLDDDDDGVPDGTDCGPLDPAVSPLAFELPAGGVDGNCDAMEACWADTDGDGQGGGDIVSDDDLDCTDEAGMAGAFTDCDDTAPEIFLGAPALCDGLDDDCSQGDPSLGVSPDETDDDNDGYLECGAWDPVGVVLNAAGEALQGGGDCDDAAVGTYPGAPESCDGEDADCDGDLVDGGPDSDSDGIPDCVDVDLDADGSEAAFDCDDGDPTIYPDAPESCDGIDSDCDDDLVDGEVDTDSDGDPDCWDSDDDGDASLDAIDCGPLDPTVFPGAPELCDAVDSDCDGDLVEGDADWDSDGMPDCADDDDDGDSWSDGEDCAPFDPSIHPDAAEACDAVDSDCDGDLNDGFLDTDQDGTIDCDDLDDDGDGSLDVNDCAPLDDQRHPGADESCDAIDSDCDGDLLEGLPDEDGDGLPDCDVGDDDSSGDDDDSAGDDDDSSGDDDSAGDDDSIGDDDSVGDDDTVAVDPPDDACACGTGVGGSAGLLSCLLLGWGLGRYRPGRRRSGDPGGPDGATRGPAGVPSAPFGPRRAAWRDHGF